MRAVSRLAPSWRPLLLLSLVVVAVYVVAGYGYGKPLEQQGEPSFLIKAGDDFAAEGSLPAGTLVNRGTGYDGQFFFYIAEDPLLRNPQTLRSLDAPGYRYRRILLPALGWATSGGNPELLQWTLPSINLAAILLSALFLAQFLIRRDRSPWLALAYALSAGLLVGTLNDVADPLAASLLVVGVLAWVEDRTGTALLALGLAPFARELYLAPLLVIAVIELLRWRQRAWPWLIPPVAFGVWSLIAHLATSDAASFEPDSPGGIPFHGALEKIDALLQNRIVGTANWELLFIVVSIGIWGLVTARSLALAPYLKKRTWPTREQCAPVVAAAALVYVPFLTSRLWDNPLSFVRYLAPAGALLVIIHATTGDRWALGFALALLALSVINPMVGILPTNLGPVFTPG